MRYIPNTPDDRTAMLAAIGAGSFAELISGVPAELLLKAPLRLPPALTEPELMSELGAMAASNVDTASNACFLGAGAYDHFIPSVIGHLATRAEFATSYTPYQAEVSQGTLQATFEYQSMVCELTGMEAANASMYDGASATAEAALMAQRVTKRAEVAVSTAVHPHYRKALRTYMRGIGSPVLELPYSSGEGVTDLDAMRADVTGSTAAVIIQYPNFFGCIEDVAEAAKIAHDKGALLVVIADPIALGLLKSPGELGADIAVGEGQPLGKSLSFGGPYLGLFACREEHLRQMPGRVVGETVDAIGKRGYVLTLQAREQHIKRERATSNICTNEALIALMAAIYMAAMGKSGIRRVAGLCVQKSHYALDELVKRPGVTRAFSAPFFKEFAVKTAKGVGPVNKRLLKQNIIGGLDLGAHYPELKGRMLVAVTEKRTKEEIDRLAGCF
ncbi:MAG: aminomethyl-transferring glycine dehydrogenase subunit GcvPA [Nitrospirae bacterium]|nr:aminomethyl-transferring glycine dehydrogenase subunit GcvPA [Nitrospirota bacterium]